MVKKSEIKLYKNLRSSGLNAVSLKKGDELISVKEIEDNMEIVLITSKGMAIRFPCQEVRPTGRQAVGVKGISLNKDDQVVTGVIIPENGAESLCIVTKYGFSRGVRG